MNHQCHGDFFTAGGERFYRCIQDGTVIKSGTLLDDKCPHCQRMMVATELSHVETRQFIATQFKHPDFGWCDMTWEAIPTPRT